VKPVNMLKRTYAFLFQGLYESLSIMAYQALVPFFSFFSFFIYGKANASNSSYRQRVATMWELGPKTLLVKEEGRSSFVKFLQLSRRPDDP